ncbi:MAG: 4'-phosphopantetheinyl transferase superfamily protein [Candidatus Eremiobacteraeota bacterium]|nr:4'-phosphopantetheinyl transferase superfamily protein [Candidatus Eremiobacteraeota bacterium]
MTTALPQRENMTVAGVDVHLWRLDLDALSEDQAEVDVTLSPDERERAERFRSAIDRRRWGAGRAALRRILSIYAGEQPSSIRFQYNEYGKPSLATANDALPLFNFSRAGGLALCATARCNALGIDVVRTDASTYESLRRYCSSEERSALEKVAAGDRQSAVIQLFAYKEAYLKARGIGFSLEPDEVVIGDFLSGHAQLVRVTGEHDIARWMLREVDAFSGHRAALALVP